jgi:hypothetical protein
MSIFGILANAGLRNFLICIFHVGWIVPLLLEVDFKLNFQWQHQFINHYHWNFSVITSQFIVGLFGLLFELTQLRFVKLLNFLIEFDVVIWNCDKLVGTNVLLINCRLEFTNENR